MVANSLNRGYCPSSIYNLLYSWEVFFQLSLYVSRDPDTGVPFSKEHRYRKASFSKAKRFFLEGFHQSWLSQYSYFVSEMFKLRASSKYVSKVLRDSPGM